MTAEAVFAEIMAAPDIEAQQPRCAACLAPFGICRCVSGRMTRYYQEGSR